MAIDESQRPEPENGSARESTLSARLRDARPRLRYDAASPLPTLLRNGQIRLVRHIGSGSMGTVYEAIQDGRSIALKALKRCSGEQIYRFKQEFRLLANVVHPNVIKARELFFEDDRWFFTMELIDGYPLDRYTIAQQLESDDSRATPREHYVLIRHLLRQLVEGVAAVHRVGLIHRDLKPSNVLVKAGGHVVILDFGLVSAAAVGGIGQTLDLSIAGTPGYLAPELALHAGATPACDWYAVGVMLYQLLTQQLPLRGTLAELLQLKLTQDPPPPVLVCPDVPTDLNDLCVLLLARDPATRPTSEQILALCRSWPSCPEDTTATAPQATTHFVGRAQHLQELTVAYLASHREAQLVLIDGAAGIGKTALLAYLGEHLQGIDNPIVLAGRCHERERVPYKGLDGVIDAFTRTLLRLSPEQLAQLLPRHVSSLTRIFPSLLRVELFRRVAETERAPADLQRAAVDALREMFVRLADQRPLVLMIDDLHWGDADGLRLLAEVLAPPQAPRMLVVATRLLDRSAQATALSILIEMHGLTPRVIALEPLNASDALELALQLEPNPTAAERIAVESGGVPFLLVDLARLKDRRPLVDSETRLEGLLLEHVERLGPKQRAALELVAVAGRPLAHDVLERAVGRAAADGGESAASALDELRAEKLISSCDEIGTIVPYHAGVTQTVRARLSDEQIRRHYVTLIDAMLACENPDAESLALFFEATDDDARAAALTLECAERMARELSFERASALYAKAFELYGTRDIPRELYLRAAEVNANCGRGSEAARLYLCGAHNAEPALARKLTMQAAVQWMRSGYVQDGTRTLRSVLRGVGIRWPRTVLETLLALGWRRLLIRLHRMRYVIRAEHADPRVIAQLDALYPAYTAFGVFDYLRGAYFAARALPLALEAGDPWRLLTTLTAEAIYCVVLGGLRAERRVARLQFDIRSIADKAQDDAFSSGAVDLASAITAYWEGNWEHVVQPALIAERRFRNEAQNGFWEANLVRSVRHTVQRHTGQFAELNRELPGALLDARAKADLYALLDLVRTEACLRLADDDSEALTEAIAEVHRVRRDRPETVLYYLLMSLDVSGALYKGDAVASRAVLGQYWHGCRRLGLHRSPLVRMMMYGMRIDCVLLETHRPTEPRIAELQSLARRAEREPVAWAGALAAAARASASGLRGDRVTTLRELAWSAEQFRARGMHTTAASVQLRNAMLLHGPDADKLCADADAQLYDMGIANPVAWTRVSYSVY